MLRFGRAVPRGRGDPDDRRFFGPPSRAFLSPTPKRSNCAQKIRVNATHVGSKGKPTFESNCVWATACSRN